jgi:bifunctional non-homologous end joining protein LigD
MASTSVSVKAGGKNLKLSNLDKVMYDGTGFTKGRVIEFYRAMAPLILPHIKQRPITLKRFPDGVSGQHFYEKNAPSFTPSWVKTFPVPRSSENSTIHYILINNLPSLIWSANLANIEIHPFLAKAPRIDRPTMLVFDLDPGEGADILTSCQAALHVKELLARLQLECFVKVSGSKGIHLHVPLNTAVSYEATQPFAKSVAQWLEREHPDLIVSEMSKTKRKGKVLVDWSQNSEHKSTVSVYSLRAKAKQPFVAMPVSWDELTRVVEKNKPDELFFTPADALARVHATGDLFAPLLKLKQKLPTPFLKLSSNRTYDVVQADALETYRRKRDFTKTSEPPPSIPRRRSQRSSELFVIQKHAARRLHYDFRLEMDGTLKSWAVPKGPPYELGERRLAMATEDHPMEYAQFEGIIPRGEYGGGTVMVWDIGTYELMDGNYAKGKLHFFLDGKKLKGEWVLVKGRNRDGKDNAWFLIKAGESMDRLPQEKDNASALTRRPMEKISQDPGAVWHSDRDGSEDDAGADPEASLDLSSLPPARIEFVEPMLAAAVKELPRDHRQWTFEIKLDGYRCLAAKDARGVKLWSRRGNIYNREFPGIARACAALPRNAVIDGEIVALDEQGRASFNLLQHRRSKASAIRFYAFDLLVYDGRNVMGLELPERRQLLARALARGGGDVQLLEALDVKPAELLRAAKELGLEGIIAKRKDSPYQPGTRSGAWVKYRINKGQELVIGGYTRGNPFDALIVGYYQDGKLVFAGKVRNGFVPNLRRQVASRFKSLETDQCPFTNLPEKKRTSWALTADEMKKCLWLEPKLVAQIEFTEWTPDKHLRHASFAGLRNDKDPQDVVYE